jgi:hypothetical protein
MRSIWAQLAQLPIASHGLILLDGSVDLSLTTRSGDMDLTTTQSPLSAPRT